MIPSSGPIAERRLHRLAHLLHGDCGKRLAPLEVELADAVYLRGALGNGQRAESRAGLPGPADGGVELVVGDLRVLLELFAGGRVNDCVHAQLDPLLVSSVALSLLSVLIVQLSARRVMPGPPWPPPHPWRRLGGRSAARDPAPPRASRTPCPPPRRRPDG